MTSHSLSSVMGIRELLAVGVPNSSWRVPLFTVLEGIVPAFQKPIRTWQLDGRGEDSYTDHSPEVRS